MRQWDVKRIAAVVLTVLTTLTSAHADGGLGSNWTQVRRDAGFAPRVYHGMTVFNSKIWIMGGDETGSSAHLNDVWSSADGITWQVETEAAGWAPRSLINAHAFNGELFVIGGRTSLGYSAEVWSSGDGIDWSSLSTSAAFGPRGLYASAVFNGKLWLIGGYDGDVTVFNDVWSSTNGIVWARELDSAPFAPRASAVLTVFNNQLWLTGGFDFFTDQFYGEVWRSSNGTDWELVTGNPPWTARDTHTVTVFQGELFLMAGFDSSDFALRDVWRSSDGANWTRATDVANWPRRIWGRAVTFNSGIWIAGGANGDDGTLADVWYTDATGTIAGNVTDSVTGLPIPCVAVTATSPNNPRLLATADLNGVYRVEGIVAPSQNVRFMAPGYEQQSVSVVTVPGGIVYRHVSLVPTSQTGGIRGRVTDADTGRALPLVQVDVLVGGAFTQRVFTCANGRYEILGLVGKGGDSVQVEVQFSSDGYTPESQNVDVSPDSVTEVDESMQKSVPAPGSLAGVVTASTEGNPAIANARITVQGLGDVSVVTDDAGVYSIAALPEDTYSVRASANGYSGDTQLIAIDALGIGVLDFVLAPAVFGDINGDEVINASDVQLVINGALGLPTGYDCDVNDDNAVDAVDVQQVINAALGIKCAACETG